MGKIRYLTAGESHGQALTGIIEGIPAGLEISAQEINRQLARRQLGLGRGERMKIENDRVQILSGIRFGKTLGSPIALLIKNRDWENWRERMAIEKTNTEIEELTVPRPGHADFAGSIKYGHSDIRNVLERASARETAMRVALGAIARKLLSVFNVEIISHVIQIGKEKSKSSFLVLKKKDTNAITEDLSKLSKSIDESSVRCLNSDSTKRMEKKIKNTINNNETVGGIFEIAAFNLPVGLGSHVHWDRRLDGRIAGAMMSIPAIKSVEIGIGRDNAALDGSKVHDEIYFSKKQGFYRTSNNAGGLEGGMTNGEPLIAHCTMKPIPTLMKPLASVDMNTLKRENAFKERSDVCAVPAASIVGEGVLSLVLADAFCEKFGGDSIEEMLTNFSNQIDELK